MVDKPKLQKSEGGGPTCPPAPAAMQSQRGVSMCQSSVPNGIMMPIGDSPFEIDPTSPKKLNLKSTYGLITRNNPNEQVCKKKTFSIAEDLQICSRKPAAVRARTSHINSNCQSQFQDYYSRQILMATCCCCLFEKNPQFNPDVL